ncbi:MAG: DUF2378 family protein [Holophagales bacterium]|nr:DUF2378 family protein [Holophagales bacterium]
MRDAIRALVFRHDEASTLLDEDLRHYLGERVLVASWYPEEDHVRLMKVVAQLYAQPGKDVWQWMGVQTARMDLRELYASMVAQGRPQETLKRFPALWRLYRTAGRAEVQTLGSRRGIVRLYDYPFLCPEIERLLGGYLEEALRLSGASEISAQVTSPGRPVGPPVIWVLEWRTGGDPTPRAGVPGI